MHAFWAIYVILIHLCRPKPFWCGYGIMTSSLGDVLRSSQIFSEVESASVEELVPTLHVIELADGEALVSQGDPAEYLYILICGRLRAIGRNRRNEECL